MTQSEQTGVRGDDALPEGGEGVALGSGEESLPENGEGVVADSAEGAVVDTAADTVAENSEDAGSHPAEETVTLPRVSALRASIESVVLVLDDPAPLDAIARAVGASEQECQAALEQWQAELDSRGSGMDLRCVAGGWRLYTRAEHAPAVEAFLLDGSQSRLSRAALETLAVVAYRQPVTRAQVAAVRGVNCDGVMRTLTLRGLIVESGQDPASGAHLYETTDLFLETMGLTSVDQLPDLAPLLPDVDSILDEL